MVIMKIRMMMTMMTMMILLIYNTNSNVVVLKELFF